jgi:hypothetical protein
MHQPALDSFISFIIKVKILIIQKLIKTEVKCL